ncbi:MAG TPA: hypothetical protein VIG24_11330 [Acidimicrobiia bacterium]
MARNFAEEARAMFPWLTGGLLDQYATLWEESGSAQTALSQLRQTSVYERTFRGIRRDDGTLRMDENQYMSTMVGYRTALAEFGLDPARFQQSDFVRLIEQEVSGQEFFAATQQAKMFAEPGAQDNQLSMDFMRQFIGTGSQFVALENVRASDRYRQVFAGNVREDGTIRMDEQDYFAYQRGFERLFLNRGLNPEPFLSRGRFREVVEGEVSIRELDERLTGIEQGVLGNTQETIDFFVSEYGQQGAQFLANNGTRATALAMAIDPQVGSDILAQRITASQIGGEAAIQGFRRRVDRAEELARGGVSQQQARQFFGMASQDLAGIGATTARFHRGGTSLENLEDAFLLGSGEQQQRIGRALQSEGSNFTGRLDLRRDRETGGLTGLLQR